jgi:hypothetical protein
MVLLEVIAESHMMQCMVLAATGYPCPGCGFQRSLSLLFHGEILASVDIFPALIPFLVCILFLPVHLKFGLRSGHHVITGMVAFTAALMIVNYIVQLALLR